jgi:hypothetical protein
MKKILAVCFAILLAFVFSSPVSAKMINGKVSLADSETRKLIVQTVDAVTGGTSESEIWINEDAAWSGADSIAALKAGDTIWVEAEQDPEGNWKASKVTRSP